MDGIMLETSVSDKNSNEFKSLFLYGIHIFQPTLLKRVRPQPYRFNTNIGLSYTKYLLSREKIKLGLGVQTVVGRTWVENPYLVMKSDAEISYIDFNSYVQSKIKLAKNLYVSIQFGFGLDFKKLSYHDPIGAFSWGYINLHSGVGVQYNLGDSKDSLKHNERKQILIESSYIHSGSINGPMLSIQLSNKSGNCFSLGWIYASNFLPISPNYSFISQEKDGLDALNFSFFWTKEYELSKCFFLGFGIGNILGNISLIENNGVFQSKAENHFFIDYEIISKLKLKLTKSIHVTTNTGLSIASSTTKHWGRSRYWMIDRTFYCSIGIGYTLLR